MSKHICQDMQPQYGSQLDLGVFPNETSYFDDNWATGTNNQRINMDIKHKRKENDQVTFSSKNKYNHILSLKDILERTPSHLYSKYWGKVLQFHIIWRRQSLLSF